MGGGCYYGELTTNSRHTLFNPSPLLTEHQVVFGALRRQAVSNSFESRWNVRNMCLHAHSPVHFGWISCCESPFCLSMVKGLPTTMNRLDVEVFLPASIRANAFTAFFACIRAAAPSMQMPSQRSTHVGKQHMEQSTPSETVKAPSMYWSGHSFMRVPTRDTNLTTQRLSPLCLNLI